MGKIYKIINITWIFALILIFHAENHAYSVEINTLRVPVGGSGERILYIKNAVTDEGIEGVIKKTVLISRIGILRYLGGAYDNPFSAGALEHKGPCREVSADVGKILMFIKKSDEDVEIFRYQASEIFEGHKHLFTVLRHKDKYYLIDTTFIQFFNSVHESANNRIAEKLFGLEGLFYPWCVLRESKNQKWAEMAGALLKNGYIELTDESANMYGILLRGRIPADRIFNRDNIIKSRVAESRYGDDELFKMFDDMDRRVSLARDPKQLDRIDKLLRESLIAIPIPVKIGRFYTPLQPLADKIGATHTNQVQESL